MTMTKQENALEEAATKRLVSVERGTPITITDLNTTRELLSSSKPDLVHLGRIMFKSLSHDQRGLLLEGDNVAIAESLAPVLVAERLAEAEKGIYLDPAPSSMSTYQEQLLKQLEKDYQKSSTFKKALESTIDKISKPPDVVVSSATFTTLTVIVHGTWASSWWRPRTGDFWVYLQNLVGTCYDGEDPYYWSGDWSHQARVVAARKLLIWARRQTYDKLVLVCHSHGGNVCFLASALGLKIDRLVTLGTPIREDYQPNMQNVGEIVNVYSTNDKIQVADLGGVPHCDGRTLCENEKAINHRALNDGTGDQPKHSELHEGDTWRASNIEEFMEGPTS